METIEKKSQLYYLIQQLEHDPDNKEYVLEQILNNSESKEEEYLIILRKSQKKDILEKTYELLMILTLSKEDVKRHAKLAENDINRHYFDALLKTL